MTLQNQVDLNIEPNLKIKEGLRSLSEYKEKENYMKL
jgi:hypothetical protein